MKKQLLTGAFLLASFFAVKAQVLQAENFNNLTVGNVGTDLTGATAGQGDFFTFTAVGDNSDFQIVANGNNSNGLQLTGAADASGTTAETNNTRFLWRNGLDTAWEARTEGNEIISYDYKFYTGPIVAGSTNQHRVVLNHYNADNTVNVLGGFLYFPGTGELRGLCTFNNGTQTGLFTITLSSATGGAVLEANTWYTVSVSVVPSTGEILWKSNDITVTDQEGGTGLLSGGVTSTPNVGLAPHEINFVAVAGANNTASTDVVYDDYRARAIASADDILGGNKVEIAQLSVFPNPANDVVNVTVDAAINNISVVDLNGRTVKNVKFADVSEASVNVSDLSAGVYMMTVSSDKGSVTKKIVKN